MADYIEATAASKPLGVYHHGDLRAALIAAAREALETASPEAVTLKGLAARLGVSQPAPYRHFANREALLAAVAADGFRRFSEAIETAAAAGPPDQAFERGAMAYVRFGQSNPGVYRLMFSARLAKQPEADSGLAEAAAASFSILIGKVGRSCAADPRTTALWIWAALHGIVMLDAEGLMPGPDGAGDAAQAVHALIATLQGREG